MVKKKEISVYSGDKKLYVTIIKSNYDDLTLINRAVEDMLNIPVRVNFNEITFKIKEIT